MSGDNEKGIPDAAKDWHPEPTNEGGVEVAGKVGLEGPGIAGMSIEQLNDRIDEVAKKYSSVLFESERLKRDLAAKRQIYENIGSTDYSRADESAMVDAINKMMEESAMLSKESSRLSIALIEAENEERKARTENAGR
ncbi:MAG: hypothetical protein AAB467_03815 [Patescibacteria group bacterium]